MGAGSRVLAAAATSLAALTAGCAEGERTFTAEQFVAEANRNGARLELQAPLSATGADAETYAVALEPGGEKAGGGEGAVAEPEGGEESHEHGGGSLQVMDTAGDAEEEHRRCEAAGLLCYRAANMVVIFEQEADPEALARLADALRAMESS
jgi:hypothetical protein